MTDILIRLIGGSVCLKWNGRYFLIERWGHRGILKVRSLGPFGHW